MPADLTPTDTTQAGPGGRVMAPPPPRKKVRRFNWLDALIIATIVAFGVTIVVRLQTSLNYSWDWGQIIPNYVFRYDEETGRWLTNLLAKGFLTTIRLTIWGSIIAAVIGVAMGLCRISNVLFLRLISRSYVELIRNLPPLVFIFVFFFFIAGQVVPLLGIDEFVRDASPTSLAIVSLLFGTPKLLTNFVSGLIVLSLFEGAFVTEIVRAGIQSIAKGQWEAGRSIGLSRWQLMRDVILPQALHKVFPPLAGQFINVVKDSSIISLISIQELTFSAVEVAVSTGRVFEVWLSVAVMYFAICFLFSTVFRQLERRTARARG